MNKLNNILAWDYFYVYLSGPIDYARGNANVWREEWIKKLVQMGFKRRQIFNPCKKPLEGAPFNLDNEGQIINLHRSAEEYDELCKVVKQIAHVDLRLVDLSSLVLVNFPCKGHEYFHEFISQFDSAYQIAHEGHERGKTADALSSMRSAFYELLTQAALTKVPTFGTIHEIVEARRQKKPVFIVWPGGKKECSGWLMWLVGHNNVFGSFEEMAVKLFAISSGKEEYDPEDWLLLNLDKQR